MSSEIAVKELKVTHHGLMRLGDLTCEAVVLENGERGYVRSELAKLLGFHETYKGGRFIQFLGEIAPNSLNLMQKKGCPILTPSGQRAWFFPAGIICDLAMGVLDAALEGRLHPKRRHMLPAAKSIVLALAKIGEVGLIDEATGYQYHRAPDDMQRLFAKLLRQSVAAWQIRFTPEYYSAICKMLNIPYGGKGSVSHPLIGSITRKWVYETILPEEFLDELCNRKNISDKHHQWLTDGGVNLLNNQINAVTLMARTSTGYSDFDERCGVAFGGAAVQLNLLAPGKKRSA